MFRASRVFAYLYHPDRVVYDSWHEENLLINRKTQKRHSFFVAETTSTKTFQLLQRGLSGETNRDLES